MAQTETTTGRFSTPPEPGDVSVVSLCGRDLGTRPYWMSPWQYDECPCVLPKGHDGDCVCSCKATDGGTS